jgi:hypothetical protein
VDVGAVVGVQPGGLPAGGISSNELTDGYGCRLADSDPLAPLAA